MVCQNLSLSRLGCGDLAARSLLLLSQLRSILTNADPVSYLRNFLDLHQEKQHVTLPSALEHGSPGSLDSEKCCKRNGVRVNDALRVVGSKANVLCDDDHGNSSLNSVEIIKSNNCHRPDDGVSYSDGRTFFLNRLKSMGPSTSDHCDGVTLPELLHPMKTLVRVFIATFTCDVSWFLSCCQVPNHLPITIACHNSERCWSGNHDSRTSAPYGNYPNLLLVYPTFPDVIAFGKDLKKQGVACHHPKLIVLQRDESLRVIVTSANLVPKQAKQIMRCKTSAGNFLGSVQATVVGLGHRFHASTDPNGGQLKFLASILGICRENTSGTLEVILKRSTNIPADANAVSVVIAADLDEFSEGDSVQLGFLPRDVAKWLSPLSDIGFFSFSAFIYPKEALAAAFGGSNTKVQLLLSVSEGPTFSEMPRLICPEHYVSLCSLVASLQRCLGLWRLREVLSQYKWPESLEVDFVYGSSSIGTSVNLQFVSDFSAAVGKKSCQYPDSNESDPEWGCWTTANELKRPSIKILFPTIERLKNGHCGIQHSRRLLSLSERTWQRLKTTGIFCDAIPNPRERLGYPMHVKVAQRRFRSGNGMFSFGWIYIGSHNFSPAAWGHTLLPSSEAKAPGSSMTTPKLRICNYELGIVLIVPPLGLSQRDGGNKSNLDDFVLPFVMPAPKYQDADRPATAQAMRETLADVTLIHDSLSEDVVGEDILDEEEEIVEEPGFHTEKEEEKIYAEMLWGQMDSYES